jgi:magnesium-transporting ATPase (P-type)
LIKNKIVPEEFIDKTSTVKEGLLSKDPNTSEVIYVKDYDDSCEELSKIERIIPLKVNCCKQFSFIFVSFITLGIPYILSVWFPKLLLFFVYSFTDNYSSSHYGIYCKDKKFYIEQCHEIKLPDIIDSHLKSYSTFGSYNNKVKIFDFKLFKYVFNQEKNSFSSLKFKIKATNENIHEYFTKGLNSQEFLHQRNIFGICDIDIVVNSVFSLILKELSDPFYIFQIFSILLWLVEGYYNYSAVLIMTTVISITIAIKETRSNLLNIKKMARYSCNINVFRVNEVSLYLNRMVIK